MWKDWFTAPPNTFLFVGISFVAVYATIIALTRWAGLRSFSKMSAPDFAMTVAVGSLFGSSIATSTPPLPTAIFALSCLFGGQWFVAMMRRRSKRFAGAVDNSPLMLMDGSRFMEDNMRRSNVTRDDIRAKLREANVVELKQVRAVIFEATGDLSVLHSSDPDTRLDEELLRDVKR